MLKRLLLFLIQFFQCFLIVFTANIKAQEFKSLGSLPGVSFSTVDAMSPDGRIIVGQSGSLYMWTEETGMVAIDIGINNPGIPRDVSNNGIIAIRSGRWSAANGYHSIESLEGHLNDSNTSVWGISADGNMLCGTSRLNGWQAFHWTSSSGTQPLGQFSSDVQGSEARAISADGSTCAGVSNRSQVTKEAVRWKNGTMQGLGILPGATSAIVPGVSSDGSYVVGYYEFSSSEREAFIWSQENGLERLGFPSETSSRSEAWGVSADGKTVVGAYESSSGRRAAIWRRGEGMQDLKQVLEEEYDLDVTGWALYFSYLISSDGKVIAGRGWHPDHGTVAWRAELAPLEEKEIIVNSSADRANLSGQNNCDTGLSIEINGEDVPECTLRAAIQTVNNRARADSITLNVDGGGSHTITLATSLPVSEHPVIIDATTQPGYNGLPLITIAGQGIIPNGFALEHGKSVVRGFSIGGFTNSGILISGGGENLIEANHIGINATGTAAFPNRTGLIIDNSSDNQIGGPEPGQMNVISGNIDAREGIKMQDERTGIGILIDGNSATGNTVQGNLIGTDFSGGQAIANGYTGVFIYNVPDNLIGGETPEAGNLISGNSDTNIIIFGKDAVNNHIYGNIIGTNREGTAALGSTETGIAIGFGSQNRIGGSASTAGQAPGNLISGHKASGITVVGLNLGMFEEGEVPDEPIDIASGNIIAGNLIGTNKDGTSAIPNQFGVVAAYDAHKTQVGPGNVISGNEMGGVLLADTTGGLSPIETVIAGNFIGTSINGNQPLGNGGPGVMLTTLSFGPGESTGIPGVVIGGNDLSARNIIAGNQSRQIDILGPMSAGTVVKHNYIGVLANGQAGQNPEDSEFGIYVNSNEIFIGEDLVGGKGPNVIGGNDKGIVLIGSQNIVSENRIGTNPGGTVAVPNNTGIWVLGDGNILVGNTVSGNAQYGVMIGQEPESPAFEGRFFNPDLTLLTRNIIGANAQGRAALGNGLEEEGAGVVFWRGKSLHMYLNILSGNHHGVRITNSPSESGTRMAANFIGVGGLIPNEIEDVIALPEFVTIPNRGDGVHITDGRVYLNNQPQLELLTELTLGNFIQNNLGAGVRRTGSNMSADLEIKSNFFFGNTGLGIDIGPDGPGAGDDFHEPPVLMQPVFSQEDRALLRGVSGVSGDLQLYTTPICHSSGTGEGRLHLSDHDQQVSAGQEFSADVSLPGNLRVGFYMTALVTNNSRTSEFSKCMRIASEEKYQEQLLDELAESTLILLRLTLELEESQSSTTQRVDGIFDDEPARIYAVEFDLPADHNIFEGNALATDGLEITPNVIDSTIYWTLGAISVPAVNYSICVDVSPGAEMPDFMLDHDRHVLMYRPGIGSAWQPLDTTIGADGSLCASGLSSFGDIAIGTYDENLPTSFDRDEEQENHLPVQFTLSQNYPNPFNPVTVIPFDLPEATHVRLAVYDMLGRRVEVLTDGYAAAGRHEVVFSAQNLSTGVYLYRLDAAGFSSVRKMLLVK